MTAPICHSWYRSGADSLKDTAPLRSLIATHITAETLQRVAATFDNPEMGSTVDDIRQGYRCFLHESHVIFYTHDEQAILIVRILHKRMDVVRSLQD